MTYATGYVEARQTVPPGVALIVNELGAVTVPLTAGDYYPSELAAHLQTRINAVDTGATWTVSISTTTGLCTIECTEIYNLTWSDTNLRDSLGFVADISAVTSATGTKQVAGMWIPDRPITCDQDPRAAPEATDLRTTTSPTGAVYALVGNVRYRHTTIQWMGVASDRSWSGAETQDGASWQTFFRETQLGLGHSWFSTSSKLRIVCHDGSEMGQWGNAGSGVDGWWITGVTGVAPKKTVDGFHGLFTIELPELVSDG